MDFVASKRGGAGILYVATRRGCDEIAELLRTALRRKVGVYHAGMQIGGSPHGAGSLHGGRHHRSSWRPTRSAWASTKPTCGSWCTTTCRAAWRRTIRKRAEPAATDSPRAACCSILRKTRCIQEFFIENAYPSRATVARVYEFLCGLDEDPIEVTQQELKDRLSLEVGGEGIGACEQLLERCGAIERLTTQENLASVRIHSHLPTLAQLLPKEATAQRRVLQAIEQIVGAQRTERVYFSLGEPGGVGRRTPRCGVRGAARTPQTARFRLRPSLPGPRGACRGPPTPLRDAGHRFRNARKTKSQRV